MVANDVVSQLIAQLRIPPDDDLDLPTGVLPNGLEETYLRFLAECDGGYTQDCYIHLFGKRGPRGHNIFDWNSPDLWKKYYGLDDTRFCFAEDMFGNQYCFDLRERAGTVKMLMVDDGDFFACSPSFEFFIESNIFDHETFQEMRALSESYFQLTGTKYPMLHHLSYKQPLLLGGSDSDVDNLELARSAMHVRLLGQIVAQVKSLPKGTRITKVLVDEERLEVRLVAG